MSFDVCSFGHEGHLSRTGDVVQRHNRYVFVVCFEISEVKIQQYEFRVFLLFIHSSKSYIILIARESSSPFLSIFILIHSECSKLILAMITQVTIYCNNKYLLLGTGNSIWFRVYFLANGIDKQRVNSVPGNQFAT